MAKRLETLNVKLLRFIIFHVIITISVSFIFYKQHNCITQKIFQLSQVRLCGGISRFITFLHLANVLIQHDYNLMERNGHLPGSYEVMMSMYVTACTHWYL